MDRMTLIRNFHQLYFDSRIWLYKTSWLGVPVLKSPTDLWIYQEMIHQIKPDLIIETGTNMGGSALFLASMCDLVGNGQVVSVDIVRGNWPQHPRLTYMTGSSTDPAIVNALRKKAEKAESVLVILDSDHRKDHVLNEMRLYGPMVTQGSYMVVEDTIIGNPVVPEFGPGPAEAVQEFLAGNQDFLVDRSKEKFLLTFHPGGFLLKIR